MALQAKVIKQKISSVKNIRKITRAMEMVSANKMRKAVLAVTQSKPFVEYAYNLLLNLEKNTSLAHPFFTSPSDADKTLIIAISSNRGLCGAYNTNIRKKVSSFVKNNPGSYSYIAIGKYVEKTLKRLDGEFIASFTEIGEFITEEDIWAVNELIMSLYYSGAYKHVYIFYTEFKTSLSYVTKEKHILPIKNSDLDEVMDTLELNKNSIHKTDIEYAFEPNAHEVLNFLLPRIVEVYVYQSMLEASASEHSSRMVAMKNASDNAKKLVEKLTIGYNRARQASITQEIAEISAGSMM